MRCAAVAAGAAAAAVIVAAVFFLLYFCLRSVFDCGARNTIAVHQYTQSFDT